MAPKGQGIRQKLAASSRDTPPVTRDQISGGIRQRLNLTPHASAGSASSTISNTAPRHAKSIKRRLDEVAAAPECEHTPFNDLARNRWSKGKMSSREVLEWARAAQSQGMPHVGKYAGRTMDPKNAHREVLAALGKPPDSPDISWVEVPSRGGKSVTNHPIICPIDLIESMVRDKPKFQTHLLNADGDQVKFWKGLRDQKSVVYESVASLVGRRTLGLGLHGDGAPTNRCDSMFTLAFNSLHARGPTCDTRNIITVFKKSDIQDGALDLILQRIAWAFNALADGVMPAEDYLGKPHPQAGRQLASGWNFLVVQLRGDWEFYSDILKFQRHSHANCCWICGAELDNRNGRAFTDASADCGWRCTLRTHESYILALARANESLPCLFLIKALRHEGVMVDVLHAVDQGVASHVTANVFFELMAAWGPNFDEQVKELQRRLKVWYGTQTDGIAELNGKMTIARIKTSADWPKLKAKAACTRHLVRFAYELARDNNTNSPHDLWRLGASQCLNRFYEILYEHEVFFPAAVRAELSELAPLFMRFYGNLSAEAFTSRKRLWKLVPKFHTFVHLCETQSFLNPRFFWTYSDEDLQKHMKEVANSCHPMNLPHMVIFKWLVSRYDP